MITVVRLFQQSVMGSGFILSGAVICVILSIVIFIVFKYNRYRKSILAYLLFLLIALGLCDLFLFSYLFPHGDYFNRGLIGACSLLILPLSLISLNIFLTLRNKKNYINRSK